MGKLYKFSHSVGRGGWHVIVKTRNNEEIFRSEGIAEKVKDALFQLREKYRLMDVTVAIFPHHVHMIFGLRPTLVPQKFGEEVFESVRGLVRRELGHENILDEDFYVATVGGAEPDEVDKLLKGLGQCRKWFWE